jgi:hypothetical protein
LSPIPASDRKAPRQDRIGHGVWRAILDDARWAPSPHNTQPWLVRVLSPEAAELYAPRERLLLVEDPDGRFETAGQGIFLEALDVAAGELGLTVETDPLFPSLGADAEERPLVARLRLRPREEPVRFDAELLRRRRTSRLPYDGRPVDEQVLAELSAIAAEFGHQASFASDPALVDWVLSLNADTVFYDLDEDDRREEIGSWTHLSERTAQARGDGFSPRSLGFPAPLVRLFFHRHRVFRPRLVRALARRLYLRSMGGTATVGWIAGPWSTPEDCLAGGRMLLRFWLALTVHGLYLQPYGSVITNPTAHARLAERLQVREGEREIWLLLRIGSGPEPPRSVRRPLAEILA